MRRPEAAAHVTEAFPPRWSFLKRVPARSMTRCSPATALIPAFARGLYLAASVSGAGSHGSPSSPLRSISSWCRPSDGMDAASIAALRVDDMAACQAGISAAGTSRLS